MTATVTTAFWDAKQVCTFLGNISRKTLSRWVECEETKFPAPINPGSSRLKWSVEAVRNWVKEREGSHGR